MLTASILIVTLVLGAWLVERQVRSVSPLAASRFGASDPRAAEIGGRPDLQRFLGVMPEQQLASALLHRLLLLGLGALGLAFVAAWVGSRWIAHPLRALAETMSEISRTGRVGPARVAPGEGRELRLLQCAFDRMLGSLQEAERARERSYVEAIGAVMAAIDRRDQESAGHSYRVASYAVALARHLGLHGEVLRAVEWGALLHDVGKIAVPDQILRKSGPLTETEWEIMRQHPRWGYEILIEVDFLHPALEIVYCHHERWDGEGYPRGLSEDRIPLSARIFSVVDTYDAITSDRRYRGARSHDEALAELRRVAGTQLDPEVTAAFLDLPAGMMRQARHRVQGTLVHGAAAPTPAEGLRLASSIEGKLTALRTGTGG